MAGVTASTRDQFVALLGVRKRLAFRQFKGRPNEGWLTLGFLIVAFPLPFFLAAGSAAAYRRLAEESAAEVLGLVLVGLWLAWLIVPALIGSINDSIDLSRLIVLPVRRRALVLSMIVGTVFDFSTLFSGPFVIAAWAAWTRGPAIAWLLVALAIMTVYANMIIAGQLTTTVIAGISRSRRFRDLVFVLVSVVALAGWIFTMTQNGEHELLRTRFVRALESGWRPLEVLQWLPPGACARSIQLAAAGSPAAASAWLAYAVAWLGVLTATWWRLLTHVTTQGGFFSARARTHARNVAHASEEKTTLLDRWWSPTTAELVRADMRLMWRSPRRRMATLQGVLMPLIFGWLWFHGASSGTLLAFAPAMLVGLAGLFVYQNAVGEHGVGVATVFLSPLSREEFFRARSLSFAILALAPALVACVFVATKTTMTHAATSALLTVSLFLVLTAVASSIAVAVATPVQDDGKRAAFSGNALTVTLALLVEPILIAALWAPVWVPVVVALGRDRGLVAVIVAALGVPYAALIHRVGMRRAGNALLRREPDLFLSLELNKPR